MKTGLPNFASELRANLVRETTLDALHTALDCLPRGWGKQDMDMFWHDDKAMEPVSPLFTVMEERLEKKFGICGP